MTDSVSDIKMSESLKPDKELAIVEHSSPPAHVKIVELSPQREVESSVNPVQSDTSVAHVKFKLCDSANRCLYIQGGVLSLESGKSDLLFIGKHQTLVLIHKNLVYELGMDLDGTLIPNRAVNIKFSVKKVNNASILVCNDFLTLSSNLKFTTGLDSPLVVVFQPYQ